MEYVTEYITLVEHRSVCRLLDATVRHTPPELLLPFCRVLK